MSEETAFRNWIDKIAESVPGFRGYYRKEDRREADQLLREKISSRLKKVKDVLNEKGRLATKSGDLGPLDEIARIDKHLEKLDDSIRYANYGYSGFFDRKEISTDTLSSVYEIDETLMKWAENFTDNINVESHIAEISEEIKTGFNLLEKRSKIIEGD